MAEQGPDTPITATCHCGGITVTAPRRPAYVNECQCTLCRRYAVAWAYYDPAEVKVDIKEGAATTKYIWGDRDHSFDFCSKCGCMCYWWPVKAQTTPMMGLNTRLVDPDEMRWVTRKIDYDQLFVPIEAKDSPHPEDKAKY
ncbi:uncharacterized protein PV07_04352 [Cladophialophora immunda]|uniref:CENP-V/GFA domain-containing protein n=1 Tax=Cladophialophora immunda TaxID=569365 RepID=A0A0D2CS75_9EURO|nr:uncharacterized protein PV07_04352 [Cladophialophora immunda]KIW32835.1 hypothetical protein PV07_04352 [Cladophialophora immunda]OQU95435.1 hypothetical protein CLAIMM_01640 [Cladophialophora immunda]